MAKSRATAAKRTGARRKRAKSRRRAPRARGRYVDLKPAHAHMSRAIAQLRRVEQTAAVKSALTRLKRCLQEIDNTCGPDMIVPISTAR